MIVSSVLYSRTEPATNICPTLLGFLANKDTQTSHDVGLRNVLQAEPRLLHHVGHQFVAPPQFFRFRGREHIRGAEEGGERVVERRALAAHVATHVTRQTVTCDGEVPSRLQGLGDALQSFVAAGQHVQHVESQHPVEAPHPGLGDVAGVRYLRGQVLETLGVGLLLGLLHGAGVHVGEGEAAVGVAGGQQEREEPSPRPDLSYLNAGF